MEYGNNGFTQEDDFLRHSHVEIVTETAVVVVIVETGRPVIGKLAVHPDAFGHLHLVAYLLGEIRIVHAVVHLEPYVDLYTRKLYLKSRKLFVGTWCLPGSSCGGYVYLWSSATSTRLKSGSVRNARGSVERWLRADVRKMFYDGRLLTVINRCPGPEHKER